MTTAFLTLYVLIWPVLAGIVLAILSRGVWRDLCDARENGEQLV